MGRITGPESRGGRSVAAGKALILATPTVDIGYNFDKGGDVRQNIDFLFFDARSGDEFIQRLGRVGRVLGKQRYDIPSRVYAVVDPEFYKALQQYDRQELSRAQLRKLAEEILPKRNDLYAYIESEAIAESFLPIYRLREMEATAEEDRIQALFESVRQLFHENATVTYKTMCRNIRTFLEQDRCYSAHETISQERLDLLERVIVRREQHPAKWLEPFAERLSKEQKDRKRNNNSWAKPQDAYDQLSATALAEAMNRNQMVDVMAGQVYWLRITMLDASVFGSFVQYLLMKPRALTVRIGEAQFEISRLLSFLLHWQPPVEPSPEQVFRCLHRQQPRAPRPECSERHWCHDRERRRIGDRPIPVCPGGRSRGHACMRYRSC
jgi:hypothetical protein